MEKIAEVEIDGYIQSSMLLTTAYKESDNALYLYATYNKKPGGMLVIKYDLANKTLTKEALYTPTGDKVEYNICSSIANAAETFTSRMTPVTSLRLVQELQTKNRSRR